MPDSVDRKPLPPKATREEAQTILNTFLKEHNILVGTKRPKLEFTDAGAMMMYPPEIFAVYKDELGGSETVN